jgi:hypothetical protein
MNVHVRHADGEKKGQVEAIPFEMHSDKFRVFLYGAFPKRSVHHQLLFYALDSRDPFSLFLTLIVCLPFV